MARCFETEACVCACDNYGLASEGVCWVGEVRELGFEEGREEGCWAARLLATVFWEGC